MSQQAQGKTTIKHKGRKYVVIHRSVTLLLLKRAGKPHFFTLEEGKAGTVVRHGDFWLALRAYSDRQDELGIEGHAVVNPAEVAEVIYRA